MIVTIRSSSSDVISPALPNTLVLLLRPTFSILVPLVQIDISLLADQVGVSSAYTLDSGQGVHNLLLAIDVGVEETQDELDCVFGQHQDGCRTGGFLQFDFSPLTRDILAVFLVVLSSKRGLKTTLRVDEASNAQNCVCGTLFRHLSRGVLAYLGCLEITGINCLRRPRPFVHAT